MKIFLDTEFIEDGKTIHPLSIGLIRDDGKEYYAEICNEEYVKPNKWVYANVIPHLNSWHTTQTTPIILGRNELNKGALQRSEVTNDLLEFCGEEPEFWGYFADYDWVLISQLFGTMMNLPNNWPKYCLDIKQEMKINQISSEQVKKVIGEGEDKDGHNALTGAKYHRKMYYYVVQGITL